MFVLDSSSSIGDEPYKKQLEFTAFLASKFKVGPQSVQFGAVLFGTKASSLFDLKDFKTSSDVQKALLAAPYLKQYTNTGEGLQLAGSRSTAQYGGRENVTKMIILLTDGSPNRKPDAPPVAKALKEDGWVILAVGIGQQIKKEFLEEVATSPDDVFQAEGFDTLQRIQSALVNRTCETAEAPTKPPTTKRPTTPSPTTPPPLPVVCGPKADIVLVMDSSAHLTKKAYEKQRDFVAALTSQFETGPNNVQFGAIAFGDHAKKLFDLNDSIGSSNKRKAILNADYFGVGANVGDGLYRAGEMFDPKHGGRENASKVILLITYGNSTSGRNAISVANSLQSQGYSIVTIGVSEDADQAFLEDVATSADDVFLAPRLNDLDGIRDDVVNRTCEDRLTLVTTPGPTVATTSVACDPMADIMFVLDSSGSISKIPYKKQLEFASFLASQFNVGPQSVQFGAVLFGTDASSLFDLNDFNSSSEVQKKLLAAPYLAENTNTGAGLKLAGQRLGNRYGGRENVSKLIILMTDGNPNRKPDAPPIADDLKKSGVIILAVGIGSSIKQDFLEELATSPDDVFQAQGFDTLHRIQSALVNRTCESAESTPSTAPPPLPIACGPLTDIVLVMDSSETVGSNLDFENQLDFAASLASQLRIGANNVQIGVVTFGNKSSQILGIDETHTSSDVQKAIRRASYFGEGVNTGSGLFRAGYMLDTLGRDKATKLVILLTHGEPTMGPDAVEVAQSLKTKGYVILTVGVGNDTDPRFLRDVATRAGDVFQVTDSSTIDGIREDVVKRTCYDAGLPMVTPPPATQPPACAPLADIIFVIDSSSSIKSAPYKEQLKFTASLISQFEVGPQNVQFGALLFGFGAEKLFDLNSFNSSDDAQNAILGAPYLNQYTNTGAGLKLAGEMFEKQFGARDDAVKIVILLTDGDPNRGPDAVTQAALLKNEGYLILAIGVGSNIKVQFLKEVATSENDVLQATNFDTLGRIQAALVNRTCENAENPVPRPICRPKADMIFVLDSSSSIGAANYTKQLGFAASLASRFAVGSKDVQFGTVLFGLHSLKLFDLQDYNVSLDIMEAIVRAPYLNQLTNTGEGLSVASNMFDGNYGGRDDAKKVIFLITDGDQDRGPDAVSIASTFKTQDDNFIVTVGVGSRVRQQFLQDIASSPGETFRVSNYDGLEDIQNDVVNRTCQILKDIPPPPPPVCDPVTDIILVIDSSYSIKDEMYSKQLEFAASLVPQFDIGPRKVQFGAVIFGDNAQKLFQLNDFSNATAISESILSAPYLNAGTNTGEALQLAGELLSQRYGGRRDATKVIILMTDGDPNKGPNAVTVAEHLKDQDYAIVTIGVGKDLNGRLLEDMATSVGDVFQAPSFDLLSSLKKDVTNRTCENAKPPPSMVCDLQADIILVIDSSSSIHAQGYEKQLEFAASLVTQFEVGPKDAQFGAVIFGDHAEKLFDLGDFSDPSSISKAVTGAKYLDAGTNTGEGLQLAGEMFHKSYGGRGNVSKIVILLTDGDPSKGPDAVSVANTLKNQEDVTILTIGVGKDLNQRLLEEMASNTGDVFRATGFDVLQTIQEDVKNRTCASKKTPPVLVCDPLSDIVLVLDSSSSIGAQSYEKQLQFAASLVSGFHVGPQDVQIGALVYGDQAQKLFDLNTFDAPSSISQAIMKATYLDEGTNTGGGLQLAGQMFDPRFGGRKSASKTIILMTDGYPNVGPDGLAVSVAESLKGQDFRILTIGVGKDVDQKFLEQISTNPGDVFQATSFDALQTIQDDVKTTLCNPPRKIACTPVADIILVMDSSTSIGSGPYDEQRKFAASLSSLFEVGTQNVQFGAVLFGHQAKMLFALNQYDDYSAVTKALQSAPYLDENTNTGEGLQLAGKLFAEKFGGRANASKIIILMTDGDSNTGPDPLPIAQQLKADGILILALGIGSGADVNKLKQMATNPNDVVMATGFDSLDLVKDTVTNQTCILAEEGAKGVCKPGDVIFVLDTLGDITLKQLQAQKTLVSAALDKLKASKSDIRVGFTTLANAQKGHFTLNQFTTDSDFKSALQSWNPPFDGTNHVASTFTYISQSMLDTSHGGRPNLPQYVVIISHTSIEDPLSAVIAANDLKLGGIKVITISVDQANSKELLAISTDRDHALIVGLLSDVPLLTSNVTDLICP